MPSRLVVKITSFIHILRQCTPYANERRLAAHYIDNLKCCKLIKHVWCIPADRINGIRTHKQYLIQLNWCAGRSSLSSTGFRRFLAAFIEFGVCRLHIPKSNTDYEIWRTCCSSRNYRMFGTKRAQKNTHPPSTWISTGIHYANCKDFNHHQRDINWPYFASTSLTNQSHYSRISVLWMSFSKNTIAHVEI